MRSLGINITLDDILNILDEHYNKVKALDALNQEIFQMHMGKEETVLDWGVCLSRHLQILAASFQNATRICSQIEVWSLLWQTP